MLILPEKRFYRSFQNPKGFTSFNVIAGESDLWIAIPEEEFRNNIRSEILTTLIELREQIKTYASTDPGFMKSLTPVKVPPLAPEIVKAMANRSEKIGVGPMAGVAGAINLFVGKKLLSKGINQFIIENGGDLYLKVNRSVVVSILHKNSRLPGVLGVELPPGEWGVSTSSSRMGHSLSLGRTDIATVVGRDPVLTDCSATHLGNSRNVEEAKSRAEELLRFNYGTVALIDGKFVISGNLKLVRLT